MNPWDIPCTTCGHKMREHILDWERTDDMPDCTQDDCACFEFQPGRWEQYPLVFDAVTAKPGQMEG
jgi:hypothetical protein